VIGSHSRWCLGPRPRGSDERGCARTGSIACVKIGRRVHRTLMSLCMVCGLGFRVCVEIGRRVHRTLMSACQARRCQCSCQCSWQPLRGSFVCFSRPPGVNLCGTIQGVQTSRRPRSAYHYGRTRDGGSAICRIYSGTFSQKYSLQCLCICMYSNCNRPRGLLEPLRGCHEH
jgi:hypothetical protein